MVNGVRWGVWDASNNSVWDMVDEGNQRLKMLNLMGIENVVEDQKSEIGVQLGTVQGRSVG